MDPLTIGLVIAGVFLFTGIFAFGYYHFCCRGRTGPSSETEPLIRTEGDRQPLLLKDFLERIKKGVKDACATKVSQVFEQKITPEVCIQELKGLYRQALLEMHPDKVGLLLDSGQYQGDISASSQATDWAKKYCKAAAKLASKKQLPCSNTIKAIMGYIEGNMNELVDQGVDRGRVEEEWALEELKHLEVKIDKQKIEIQEEVEKTRQQGEEKLTQRLEEKLTQRLEEKLMEKLEEKIKQRLEERPQGSPKNEGGGEKPGSQPQLREASGSEPEQTGSSHNTPTSKS